MKRNKVKIQRVWIERVVDECPDLSDLGEYSDTPGPNAIDREERGECGSREFRYFNPALSGDETGNPKSPEQDYQRCESFNRGDWYMVGVIAKAELWNPGSHTRQTIRSAGLWGIESDSDDSYIDSVAEEELANLSDELSALGLGKRAIALAISRTDDSSIR